MSHTTTKGAKMNAMKYQVKTHRQKVADAAGRYVSETSYEVFAVNHSGHRTFLGCAETYDKAKKICEDDRSARAAR